MFAPASLHAALFINEITWMGTALSASDEWIELFNNGADSVSLSGWSLKADDGDPVITLSGSVPAGGYFLLERTDDGSVPDVPADQIYSGGLGNTGETFTLRNGTTVIDTVTGGTNWETVGGNNTTKDTPQRQEDGAWITGVPTPRAINSTVDTGAGSSGSSSPGSSSGGNKPKTSGGYRQDVFAYAGEDMTVAVGADTYFEGFGVDAVNKRLSAAQYAWSFGDGTHGKGKEIRHVYHEGGMYIVTLSVLSGSQRSKDTLVVSAVPADVSITDVAWGEGGFIEIENKGSNDINLAGWKLFAGVRERLRKKDIFIFPKDTILVAGNSIRFSARDTDISLAPGMPVIVQYPNGESDVVYHSDKTEDAEKMKSVEQETASLIHEKTEKVSVVPAEKNEEEKIRPATTTSTPISSEPSVSFIPRVAAASAVPPIDYGNTSVFLIGVTALVLGAGLFLAYRFYENRAETRSDEHALRAEDFTIIDTTPTES